MESADTTRWHKSSHSNAGADNCVEVAEAASGRLVRDSKQHGTGPILRFAAPAWTTFLHTIQDGRLDPS
jgi:hypothetical protein